MWSTFGKEWTALRPSFLVVCGPDKSDTCGQEYIFYLEKHQALLQQSPGTASSAAKA